MSTHRYPLLLLSSLVSVFVVILLSSLSPTSSGGSPLSQGTVTPTSFVYLPLVAKPYPPPSGPWPMYGHDSAHTSFSSTNGPSTPNLIWSYNVGSVRDQASPVIGPDGTIYMPAGSLYALHPDGTVKWIKAMNSSATPAVAGDGTIYFIPQFGYLELWALNPARGDKLWSTAIGYSTYGSPSIGPDATIYVGSASKGDVYAINPNGTLRWRWVAPGICGTETTPAIGPEGNIYIQHNCLGLVALDSSGHLLWTRDSGLGQAFNSASVGPDGTIYIGSSDYYFHALSSDGLEKWRVPVDNWMYDAASSIAADGSTIYRGDNMGIFYAFDRSGFLKWKYDTGIRGMISCAPALAGDNIVYFTQSPTTAVNPSDKGYLYALRASDGTLLWKYPIGWSKSSPAISADGTLYVYGEDTSGNGMLYAFR